LFLGCTLAPAAERQAVAEDVFKNIVIFKGMPAARVIPTMDALTGLLGVDCNYCHVLREWEKDDKPQKQTARKMFQMVEYLNHDHFSGENRISCWTCHRGHGKPPQLPVNSRRLEQARYALPIASTDERKPSEQVFHNIQGLTGTPAGELPAIMAYFSSALGVECTHCHIDGHWDKDTPIKQTARKMLAMSEATIQRFYGGLSPLGCPDCHQGSIKPNS
jgi:hypothetical protein